MAATSRSMITKLQGALNTRGCNVLYNTAQFYTKDNILMTMYKISTFSVSETGKRKVEDLFQSTSQIQCVLFLRDWWFYINGWEIPTDNKIWEYVKENANIDYSTLPVNGRNLTQLQS